jgi:hypothetical protein
MNPNWEQRFEWSPRGGVIGWVTIDGEELRWFVPRELVSDRFGGDGSKDSILATVISNRAAVEQLILDWLSSNEAQTVEGEKFREITLPRHPPR